VGLLTDAVGVTLAVVVMVTLLLLVGDAAAALRLLTLLPPAEAAAADTGDAISTGKPPLDPCLRQP
jgi:hypothetical protein